MIILIPLGGIGSRFTQNGYRKPKALINVMGKPILFWLLDNLAHIHETEKYSQTKPTIIIPYNKVYIQ